jgi:hypothetical protein
VCERVAVVPGMRRQVTWFGGRKLFALGSKLSLDSDDSRECDFVSSSHELQIIFRPGSSRSHVSNLIIGALQIYPACSIIPLFSDVLARMRVRGTSLVASRQLRRLI